MVARAFNWVRLDCAFSRNDKVLSLVERGQWRAISVYAFGLGHCREQRTNGFISKGALGLIHGRPRDASELVEERLWHAEPGGWMVNDWGQYQETNDELEQKSRRQRANAMKRWGPDAPGNASGIADGNPGGYAE